MSQRAAAQAPIASLAARSHTTVLGFAPLRAAADNTCAPLPPAYVLIPSRSRGGGCSLSFDKDVTLGALELAGWMWDQMSENLGDEWGSSATWDLRYSRRKMVRRWSTRNQRNSRVTLFRARETEVPGYSAIRRAPNAFFPV